MSAPVHSRDLREIACVCARACARAAHDASTIKDIKFWRRTMRAALGLAPCPRCQDTGIVGEGLCEACDIAGEDLP